MFDDKCSRFFDERKETKLQSNVRNVNNVKHKASRHFRIKRRNMWKLNWMNFNSRTKNIRDLYRGISDFKKGCQPRTDVVTMRGVICLQTPTVFRPGGRNFSFSYWMYMGLMMLGRLKYREQNH